MTPNKERKNEKEQDKKPVLQTVEGGTTKVVTDIETTKNKKNKEGAEHQLQETNLQKGCPSQHVITKDRPPDDTGSTKEGRQSSDGGTIWGQGRGKDDKTKASSMLFSSKRIHQQELYHEYSSASRNGKEDGENQNQEGQQQGSHEAQNENDVVTATAGDTGTSPPPQYEPSSSIEQHEPTDKKSTFSRNEEETNKKVRILGIQEKAVEENYLHHSRTSGGAAYSVDTSSIKHSHSAGNSLDHAEKLKDENKKAELLDKAEERLQKQIEQQEGALEPSHQEPRPFSHSKNKSLDKKVLEKKRGTALDSSAVGSVVKHQKAEHDLNSNHLKLVLNEKERKGKILYLHLV